MSLSVAAELARKVGQPLARDDDLARVALALDLGDLEIVMPGRELDDLGPEAGFFPSSGRMS